MNRYHLEERELKKHSKRKKISGVCAGLCTMPQPVLIAYGIAYFILDDDKRSSERSRHRYYDA